MKLHENIQRIKEVMGINQPNELMPVITNRFVYHKSNPIFRDQIEEDGLIVKGKSETWLSDTPIEGEVIFATNSDNEMDWFDSLYDDDIYQIDTTKIDNIWYNDPNFGWSKNNKHIITFNNIPRDAIKLIHKGTGENLDTINESTDNDKDLSSHMETLLKMGFVTRHTDHICDVKVSKVDKGIRNNSGYKVTIYFLGNESSKRGGMMSKINIKFDSILDEAWEYINDYFGFAVPVYRKTVSSCDEVEAINESSISKLKRRIDDIYPALRNEYTWLDPSRFDTFEQYLERVIFGTVRDFSGELETTDYDTQLNTREEIEPIIRDYIINNYLEELRDYYNKR